MPRLSLKNTVLILFVMTALTAAALASFRDVPRDHWAYEAIRRLVERGYMDGYADGTFRGDKPVDRYEMAVTVGRLLMRVRELETSGSVLDEEDAATIRRLMTEFRDELQAIGIRIDGLENRLKQLEEDHKSLAGKTDVVSLAGSYTVVNYYNDEKIGVAGYDQTDPGLGYVDQNLTLHMTIRPDDDTQVYMGGSVRMIRADEPHKITIDDGDFISSTKEVLTGAEIVDSTLEVNTPSGTGTALQPGTGLDVTTGTVSDYRLKSGDYNLVEGNRNLYRPGQMHIRLTGNPHARFRFFGGGEGITGTDDPAGMLGMPWAWAAPEPWNAYGRVWSGIEVDGRVNDNTTYFTSYLKQPHSGPENDADTYALRLRYTVPQGLLPDASMTVGATAVEHIRDYNKFGDFHRSTGMDISYNLSRDFSLNITAQQFWMLTGDDDDFKQRQGQRYDFRYRYNHLSSDLTFYRYEPDFVLYTAHFPRYARHTRTFADDYYQGRPAAGDHSFYSYEGERNVRWRTTYDYPISSEAKLVVEGLIDRMWWDRKDPANHDSYVNHVGQFYQLTVRPIWSSRLSGEFQAFRHLDPKPHETGKIKSRVKMSALLDESNNGRLNAEVWTLRDGDDLDMEENAFREAWLGTDYGFNLNDKMFVKVWTNYKQWNIGREGQNGQSELGASNSWTLTNSIQFDGLYRERRYRNENEWDRIWKGVFENQFSNELKGRFGYWYQVNRQERAIQHFHFDLNFQASSRSRVQLTLSPPTDWWGNSHFDQDWNQQSTVKRLKLFATTSF